MPLQPSPVRLQFIAIGIALIVSASSTAWGQEADKPEASIESEFIKNSRQLTFEGRRAGEGYFSSDGNSMVFQSERVKDNPFFQIFVLDFETGDTESISPGHGKTTCAWIHPDGNRVLFASTQADPKAVEKQKEEIAMRESGQERRYSWDYDNTYEIFSFDRTSKQYQQLTDVLGYDAEGSYSPDGKLIAFSSNRNAYTKELTPAEKKAFDIDPAVMMDIFIMNADGSNVRQLTDVMGYDGGPFFSPDGKRICWRRFAENGVIAEILTMNIDGTDQKQLTQIGAMSWAPFYHPSGKYLIFTTNIHGFGNFELYLVDVEGKSRPVRVTDTDGFDGLASFTPDGKKITWTSNRNASDPSSRSGSQIFLADWNHELALDLLSSKSTSESEVAEAFETGRDSAEQTNAGFDPLDIIRHVDFLCRKELGGRMTGAIGERKATAYVAAYLDSLGLVPAGDNGTWFQKFDFPNGAELGPKNELSYQLTGEENRVIEGFKVNESWRPLSFSGNVDVESAPVVFAGYGIVAPAKGDFEEYDSYVHLDVKDKWVLIYRFVPDDVSPEVRQHLQGFAWLRKKVFYAREHGAKGLLVMSGPNSKVRKQLVPMENDFSPNGSSIAAISVTDELAAAWLKVAGKDITELQTRLDDGSPVMGFDLKGFEVSAHVDVKKITGRGRNVIGRLMAGNSPSDSAVLVGAHIDHLGLGRTGGSLAKEDEKNAIHFGADDNASGVAAMLEVAEYLSDLKRKGKLTMKRDVIFAGWSGEELGLHGSKHFVESLMKKSPETGSVAKDTTTESGSSNGSFHDFKIVVAADGKISVNGSPQTLEQLELNLSFIGKSAPDFQVAITKEKGADDTAVVDLCHQHGVKNLTIKQTDSVEPVKTGNTGIRDSIVAALNMDMVGRLEEKLILQGIASSNYWRGTIESKNAVVGLPLTLSDDTELPTDASSFYRAGVPILSAFTGSHTDYHTPRDTPEKLNYPDAARIARLMGMITRSLVANEETPDFIQVEAKPKQATRGGRRAYLGTVPSYGEDVVGVKLSDATKGGPADEAGVKGGDIIVALAGRDIENIYDYTAILDGLKIGEETIIVVMRNGEKLELKLTPGSRQ